MDRRRFLNMSWQTASAALLAGCLSKRDLSSATGTVPCSVAGKLAAGQATVADLVEMVSEASYTDFMENRLYASDGQDRNIYMETPYHNLARDFMIQHFEECGFTVTQQNFGSAPYTATNVIGTKLGSERPDEIFIVGAHYDTVNNCPGADDNASGTAGVLEAARVLGPQTFESTIKVIAFDREEGDLEGSILYVDEYGSDNVIRMLNLDMIGAWDPSSPTATIYSQFSDTMAQELDDAISQYCDGIGTDIQIKDIGCDHHPFEAVGIPGAMLLAAGGGGNNCNHQPCDSLDTPGQVHFALASELTRAVVGYLADKAVLMQSTGVIREPEEACA
ncbi:M28 family metallopeptidase [Fibrobacterota bacterium]